MKIAECAIPMQILYGCPQRCSHN